MVDHGGFDAIIGNPPFLGGKKVSGAMSTEVREWLVNQIAQGTKGNADLVAYFFLRATSLLQRKGSLGLIATNTVAQGDSREVGLDAMVADGVTITRAIQSRSWPAASANLEYAAVWGTLGPVAEEVPRIADDIPVRRISTLLEPAGRIDGNPVRLKENSGIAFQGCIVLGMGFVLDVAEAQEWIAADPRNAEVLFPYLNGEDLNSRPDASASRWVIDFNERDEVDAARYSLPFMRVVDLVRPERQKLYGRNASATGYARLWWRFGRNGTALRKAIAELPEVLVLAQVSNTAQPMLIPTGSVPSHKLVVFASDRPTLLATLASSVHYFWARKYSGAMKNDLSYSPSDVFLTFPGPEVTDRIDAAGRMLNEERREIMCRRDLGLTKFYNLVNDPAVRGDKDVDRMRDIHIEIDEATTDAYGWNDIRLGHGFHTYRHVERWTVSPAARVEILDRLLEENHRRAEQERLSRPTSAVNELSHEEDTLFT